MNDKFDNLIKDLFIISSEKEEQIYLIGNGNVGTEMLINFGLSIQNLDEFANHKFINADQKDKLAEFQTYIDEKSDLDDNLDSEEWRKTRIMAKEILIILNPENSKVILDKSGKFWEAKLIK